MCYQFYSMLNFVDSSIDRKKHYQGDAPYPGFCDFQNVDQSSLHILIPCFCTSVQSITDYVKLC